MSIAYIQFKKRLITLERDVRLSALSVRNLRIGCKCFNSVNRHGPIQSICLRSYVWWPSFIIMIRSGFVIHKSSSTIVIMVVYVSLAGRTSVMLLVFNRKRLNELSRNLQFMDTSLLRSVLRLGASF